VTVIAGVEDQCLLERLQALAGHDLDPVTFNDPHQLIVAHSEVVPESGHRRLLLESHAVTANTGTQGL